MTGPVRSARRWPSVALVVALVSAGCALVIGVGGGFDVTVAGLRVRSNNPVRPAALALVAALVWIVGVGVGPVVRRLTAMAAWLDREHVARAGSWALAVAVLLTSGWLGSKAAGGSDSWGYISQADLWLEGRLVLPVPWVRDLPWPGALSSVTPLGFVPHPTELALSPQYSPGLPLLMAGAKLVAGHCAVFWVVPICGAITILGTSALGRRLAGPWVGLAAAWLVAASPVFVFMTLSPMSDVPVTAAWLLMFVALFDPRPVRSGLAGVAAAVAILIRPNLAPLAVPVGAWLLWQVVARPAAERRAAFWRAFWFGLPVACGAAAVGVINHVRYGSALKAGYEPLNDLYSWSNVPQNASNYLAWFSDTQTILPLLGLVAWALPRRLVWKSDAPVWLRACVATAIAFVSLQYLAYLQFTDWTFLRFFLPIWPAMMVGCCAAVTAFGSRLPAGLRVSATILIAALVWSGVRDIDRLYVLDTARSESKYPRLGDVVRRATPANSVLISMQHSGSLSYYAGRPTLNFVRIDPDALDRVVTSLASMGLRAYAVLEEWEVGEFRTRFESSSRVEALARSPVLAYQGFAPIFVYDLMEPLAERRTLEWPERFDDLGCAYPHPRPTIRADGSR